MKCRNMIVTGVMTVTLLGLSLAAWVKPADAFSDSERRELEQFPKLSWATISSGQFMDEFEDYVLDQFPMRDAFRRLKARVVFDGFQQKDNNDIYVVDGYASKMDYPLNEPMLDHAAERFQYLYDNYLGDAENIYLSIVPDKNYFFAEDHGYLSVDYEEMIQAMGDRVPFMEYIDITGALELEDYYYTDSHWRQENILDVAELLVSEMNGAIEEEKNLGTWDAGIADQKGNRGAEAADQEESGAEAGIAGTYQLNQLDIPFYGVYYGQSALPLEPDQLNYLTSDVLEQCIVTSYDTGKPVEIPLYDMDKANGKDPYEMFLSGTRAVLTIENPMAENDKELIVFRDSFGSSLIPLLAEDYAKITVLDIRYVQSSQLGNLVEFGNQDVLFLYSTMMLNSSMALR